MKVSELAKFITEFIFTEKETVLEALQNEDEDMLETEAYEYIQNCD